MHHCLGIPEIRISIVREMFPYGLGGMDDNQALLSLALTCKLFFDPCMNSLWYRIGYLRPLLCCLPSDIRLGRSGAEKDDDFPLRALTPDDIARLHSYAARVKWFGPKYPFSPIPPSTIEQYRFLFLALKGATLFPHAQKVHIYNVTPEILPFVGMLIHPCVRELRIRASIFRSPTNADRLTFSAFFLGLSSLTSLSTLDLQLSALGTTAAAAFVPQVVQGSTASLTQLQHLELDPVSFSILPRVAVIPSIRTLKVKLVSTPSSTRDQSIDQCRIRGLTKLHAECERPKDALRLLRVLDSRPSLSDICLTINKTADKPAVLTELFDEVGRRCDPLVLTSLDIADLYRSWGSDMALDDDDLEDDLPSYTFSSNHLQPLLNFKKVRYFHICCGGLVDLDDDFILKMASSLTDVTSVVLLGRYRRGTIPRPTLSSLFWIAKYWPRLTYLSMAFDARSPPQGVPETTASCPKLDLIDVQYSPIDRPLMVAAQLSDIFPALDGICSNRNQAQIEAWRKAAEMIPEFVNVRNQEKSRSGQRTNSVALT